MLQIVLKISEIDYGAVASSVAPLLLGRLGNGGRAGEALAGLKEFAGKAAGAAFNLLPRRQRDAAVLYFIRRSEKHILEALNGYFRCKGVPMTARRADARKAAHFELSVGFGEVDYGALLAFALPRVHGILKENPKYARIAAAIDRFSAQAGRMALAALAALNQDEKDELAAWVCNAYARELRAFMNEFAAQNGVKLTIVNVEARRRP